MGATSDVRVSAFKPNLNDILVVYVSALVIPDAGNKVPSVLVQSKCLSIVVLSVTQESKRSMYSPKEVYAGIIFDPRQNFPPKSAFRNRSQRA